VLFTKNIHCGQCAASGRRKRNQNANEMGNWDKREEYCAHTAKRAKIARNVARFRAILSGDVKRPLKLHGDSLSYTLRFFFFFFHCPLTFFLFLANLD